MVSLRSWWFGAVGGLRATRCGHCSDEQEDFVALVLWSREIGENLDFLIHFDVDDLHIAWPHCLPFPITECACFVHRGVGVTRRTGINLNQTGEKAKQLKINSHDGTARGEKNM